MRSLWDFLELHRLALKDNLVDLVDVELDAEAIIFLFGEEEDDFWVGDLSALRQEGHLLLQGLHNICCHLAFFACWSHHIAVDFTLFDEFDPFAEVTV